MRLLMAVLILSFCGCGGEGIDHIESKGITDKVTFDVGKLDKEGLQGQTGGKRAVSYEFCIPNTAKCKEQVKTIDPSVEFSRSRGRIGCSADQLLCIGSTHQAGFKEILAKLCVLSYIKRIDECFFE